MLPAAPGEDIEVPRRNIPTFKIIHKVSFRVPDFPVVEHESVFVPVAFTEAIDAPGAIISGLYLRHCN
jgi:hypothetical protein